MKSNRNNNQVLEQYRILRNIIEKKGGDGIKCISITSNGDNEGKAIIAKNLACQLADYGKKTLFVDCSLSGVKDADDSGINGMKGIVNILQIISSTKNVKVNAIYNLDVQIKGFIKESQFENLSVLPLGSYNLNSECCMFKTEYFRTLKECLKKDYDYIIIDAPSFNHLSFAQIVIAASDACLLVLKEGIYEIDGGHDIRAKLDTLDCKVLGCVLNKRKGSKRLFSGKQNNILNVEYTDSKADLRVKEKVKAEA